MPAFQAVSDKPEDVDVPRRMLPGLGGGLSRGFSLLELVLVLGLMAILAGMSMPMIGSMLAYFRLNGDARTLANTVSLARMQAASNFSRSRVYVDLSTNSYHTELKSLTSAWTSQGMATSLSSQNESFSFGPVSTPPPNTQATIGLASQCLDDASPPQPIPNTACIVFNSRGVPIDSVGAPSGAGALYITDGISVYGLTISITSISRTWRTPSAATALWTRQ